MSPESTKKYKNSLSGEGSSSSEKIETENN